MQKCTRILTESASERKRIYKIHYRCRSTCRAHYLAREINSAFVDELTFYIPRPDYGQLFVEAIVDAYKEDKLGGLNVSKNLATASFEAD